MLKQRKLYKRKKRNRYLKRRRQKPVTVCIAAICDMIKGYPQKIVLCADRLVSSEIQFEGGESKIKKITDYCYAMPSSNDSLASDLILERVKEKANASSSTLKTVEIVAILRRECINYKAECIERDVLFKYNVAAEKLAINQESVLEKAVMEVDAYEYLLECEFILAGLESPNEAHIYRVDQDGNYSLDDSLGFSTIGSGGGLVFLEMTKHGYSRSLSSVVAIPRVYISKKISERAEGVGRYTDLGLLYFPELPKRGKKSSKSGNKPLFADFSHPAFLQKLDETYKAIRENEKKELEKLFDEVYTMITGEKPKN